MSDKTIINRSLQRIEEEMGSVDEEVAAVVRRELAVIGCEIRKAPDPPVMDLLRGGMGLGFDPGKKYLIFADAVLIHSEAVAELMFDCPDNLNVIFCYPPSSGKLRDAMVAFDISRPTMFFIDKDALPEMETPEVEGVRFAVVSGPLGGKIQLQVSEVDAMLQRVLDICDEPLWVDGSAIAERIREEL